MFIGSIGDKGKAIVCWPHNQGKDGLEKVVSLITCKRRRSHPRAWWNDGMTQLGPPQSRTSQPGNLVKSKAAKQASNVSHRLRLV